MTRSPTLYHKFHLHLVIICAVVVITSCKTFLPSPEGDTVVIGELINIQNGREINGTFRGGISVFIKDINNDEIIKTTTQNDGFFSFYKLEEGIYELIQTDLLRVFEGIPRPLGDSVNRYFVVTKEKVNNLGIIIQGSRERHYILTVENYENVKDDFLHKLEFDYNIDWANTLIFYNLPIFTVQGYNLDPENWNITLLDTARNVDYLTEAEKDIVLELNKLRSNPKRYAELYIESMLQYFDGYLYKEPEKEEKITQEGIISAEECCVFLKGMKSVPILSPERGLSLGAKDHINDQGPSGTTGHTGTDRSGPRDRVMRYGTGGYIEENIAYGPNRADKLVISWLIDDGVPDRGHRKSLLHPEYNQVGVATGTHRRYGAMCVIEMTAGYRSN
jgi:hypothetical protein